MRNLQVVAEVECGRAAIQAAKQHRPDVVLIGNCIPFLDCVHATATIKTKFPEVRVIILSESNGISFLREAYKAGAFWCLKRGCSSREILRTIRAAET
jgi:DNA-binding NarL/FixJ family response regulator